MHSGNRRGGFELVVRLSMAYTLGLLGWQIVRLTPASGWWPFEFADIFAIWLYLPLPLLLSAALHRARRRAAVWLMPALALFVWEYGELFMPSISLTPPEHGTTLRVMTANLLMSNMDLAALGAAIEREQPDVLAVQELGTGMARYLAERLRDRYPFQALEPDDTSAFGLGIVSRRPIRVEPPSSASSDNCFCQRAVLDLPERTATLVHVHPPPPAIAYGRLGRVPFPRHFSSEDTRRILSMALRDLEATQGPVVALGDFNVSDRQAIYRRLRQRLRDAHHDAGWGLGYTFPNSAFEGLPALPLVRIDYVLHNDAWLATAARTGSLPGSDHRYLVADLIPR